MNCENQALTLLKFYKLASFNDIITAKSRNCWLKINMARHYLQSLFWVLDKGKVANT